MNNWKGEHYRNTTNMVQYSILYIYKFPNYNYIVKVIYFNCTLLFQYILRLTVKLFSFFDSDKNVLMINLINNTREILQVVSYLV